MILADAAGAAAVAIWAYLLLGRGGFWRVREEALSSVGVGPRSVVAVIPARDEAGSIGRAVQSLFAQDYEGPLRIIVVDDHSSDGTADVACRAGDKRVSVIAADPLPPGWTGKLWAVSCGVRQALQTNPDFLLLTDADVVHAPESLAQLINRAEASGRDLVSLMVKLRCESFAERALIPAFLFFFLKLYPPAWETGAAGGCMLIRRSALERIGGIGAIRNELIDDCALAREVRRGGSIWMGVTTHSYSTRAYGTFGEIGGMIARTAYNQLNYSPWLLLGTIAGMTLTYLVPPVLAIAGPGRAARVLGLTAWIAMAVAYRPSLKLYGRSWIWGAALPLIALFYSGATIYSAVQYWSGKGGLWKGRTRSVIR